MKVEMRIRDLTIHPSETFAGHHLEVNTLVTILGIYQMRKLDGIELHERSAEVVE